jgi:NAD(P)-dependent dehydrogenase (short-subunit alcohol dehydrogenase family)
MVWAPRGPGRGPVSSPYPRGMELAGKVAVITGAGSGIGRACARSLARQGASVLVADMDEHGGAETVAAIVAGGGRAEFIRVDVRETGDLTAMFEAAAERFGGFDVLCNNAGIVCGEPLWPETAPERLLDQVAVNLGAVIVGTRLAVEPLRARGGGAIVNIASLGALLPLEDEPAYSATKAGVVMFTRACARLHRTHRIRVNAVLPSLVETPLLAKSGDGSSEAAWASQARQVLSVLSPDEVADAVIDIVGDESLAGHHRIVGEIPDVVRAMF